MFSAAPRKKLDINDVRALSLQSLYFYLLSFIFYLTPSAFFLFLFSPVLCTMKIPVSRRRLVLIIVFVFLAIFLIVVSFSRLWIEQRYSQGIYPYISVFQRTITGKIPFSIGDVIYFIAFAWVTYKIVRNVYLLFVKKITLKIISRKFSKVTFILLCLYVAFLLVWGLNYSRKGIGYQLGLSQKMYDTADLLRLQSMLIDHVNRSKAYLLELHANHPDNREIFDRAVVAYQDASDSFPFLKYRKPSIKSSMYGLLGDYMGFTGYYNPLTGEAQVNTSVPRFLIPAITVHEMAHQLGYARENTANFVGFLVGTHCADPLFRYSAWFDLFLYTNSQVRFVDSLAAKSAVNRLNSDVKKDITELQRFNERYQNFAVPVSQWIYGKFLQLNKQPLGMGSYDAVVSLVLAYYKKQGLL